MIIDSDPFITTPLYAAAVKEHPCIADLCDAVTEIAVKAGLMPHQIALEFRLAPSPGGPKAAFSGRYLLKEDDAWEAKHVSKDVGPVSFSDGTLAAMALDTNKLLEDQFPLVAWVEDVDEEDFGATYVATGIGVWIFDLFSFSDMHDDIETYMSDRDEFAFLNDYTKATLARDYLGPNPGDPFSPHEQGKSRVFCWDWDDNVIFAVPGNTDLSADILHELALLGAVVFQQEMAREEMDEIYESLVSEARRGFAGAQDLSHYRAEASARWTYMIEEGDADPQEEDFLWKDPTTWTSQDVRWKAGAYDNTLGLDAPSR